MRRLSTVLTSREGGRGGPGGPWPPQYFCPAPPKSLGQVVNDPILSHPCPKELDCGLNSPENKDFGLPRPGKFFWPPQSQNPTSLPVYYYLHIAY